MSTSPSILPRIIGWLSFFTASILLAFSGFMFLLEAPPLTWVLAATASVFPALIAIACLMPSRRSFALRIIGGVVSLACIGTLIMSFVAPARENQGRPPHGMLVVIVIAGGAMAVKGKWPGRELANDVP